MSGSGLYRFSSRMARVPDSFLGELFSVSAQPGVISFAGGLPDADLFDVAGIRDAAEEVFNQEGKSALQYTTTDGYLPLRRYIASRYRSRLGLNADPDEIQIVNGSQQCLDLVAKILLNPGDHVLIERPGYLGAIEAFSFYEPVFNPIPTLEDLAGPSTEAIQDLVAQYHPALWYGIPNSQNPSGMTWPVELRREVAELLDGTGTLLYEDDAFGELFFDGRARDPVKRWLSDQTIMTGSFSKTISPGLRCGWIWAPRSVIIEFNRAKQAADLHSNLLSQMILARYLETVDVDQRIREIAQIYGERCQVMEEIIDDDFPSGTSHTCPEGGMFLMVTLPSGVDSMEIFRQGIKQKVAVMPGTPFYVDGGGIDTIRLNFSSANPDQITEGMDRLSMVIRDMG
ncbi:MAG: PLP-dependent aminotransferase family protein [Methanospirillum sp.]|uniref:aminotransferase-like domain-containing protein n=1 Tax=Methanospirillum sp. TaxID=45200 RepID=UPI002374D916|nr:PLP-dependent aminotransferase family protein [Methanospirillum sp.]MDD1728958.1 PLP-dependent aminotransferase family protein [Methanospirillum sp.]